MSLPLPDNKRPIEVGDISFVYHGVYHPILWNGEDPYRPRVETLILKDGKFLYIRKYKPEKKFKFCYRIPGGSMDNDSDAMEQARNEVYEESLIKLSKIYDTNIQYYEQYEPGFLLKNGDICIAYKGTYNRLYTGVFQRKITDKEKAQLDPHDLDDDMASNGKFYYIPDILNILRRQHVEVLLSSPDVDPDIKTIISLKLDRLPLMEGIQTGRKPVYVVSMNYKSAYGSIIKAYTNSQFNHSALSLDNTLTTMYSFTRSKLFSDARPGLNVETKREMIKRDPNTIVIINECWISENDYDNLKSTILELRKANTKYRYSTIPDHLFNIELSSDQLDNDNLVCSVFVGKMLNDNGVSINKPTNLITPSDIADLPKLSKFAMPYYYGKLSDYKLRSEFHHEENIEMLSESGMFFPIRYVPIVEAPTDEEDKEDDGETTDDTEDDSTDYTEDVEDEPAEAFEEPETTDVEPASEPAEQSEDISEDDLDSTDYTEELGEDEPDATEETPEDTESSGEETTDETSETEDGESGEMGEEDAATDYTADVSGDSETESEETTEEETSIDEETSNDTEVNKNIIIKNYNLLTDFQKIYMSLINILRQLESVIYKNPMQNDVLSRVINNLQKIKGELLSYIELHYSKKYEENLYYYSIFIQAIKLNLEMLRKTDLLEDEE